jgi:catechol 2,3-dioxygenase-like lactoylglutathione lyase family enzyme
MSTPITFAGLYHTGIVVDDIEAAKAEYGDLMGLTWGYQGESEMPVWSPAGGRTLTFAYAYSDQGPHRIELVREIADTLWTVPRTGHVHHLGFWCDDVPAAEAELVRRGMTVAARIGVSEPGDDAPIVYLEPNTGGYIELVSSELRARMFGEDPG